MEYEPGDDFAKKRSKAAERVVGINRKRGSLKLAKRLSITEQRRRFYERLVRPRRRDDRHWTLTIKQLLMVTNVLVIQGTNALKLLRQAISKGTELSPDRLSTVGCCK